MTSSTTFGQPQAQGAFGQQQQAAVGTTIKFAPIQGTDTMMKSGVQQNISTRHQVSFSLLFLTDEIFDRELRFAHGPRNSF